MNARRVLPWLMGAAVLGLVVAAAPTVERRIERKVDRVRARRLAMSHGGRMDELFNVAFNHVVITEGGGRYDAINRNTDGAGLSWGVIQFAQNPGSLGRVLAAMNATDRVRFVSTFGSQADELLRATASPGIRPVGGVALWQEPWLSRFRAAGRDPLWQQVQRHDARSVYWTGAVGAAQLLGVSSEKALTLFFDTAVNQGPGFAANLARRVVEANPGATPDALLTTYARSCGAAYRSRTQPTKPPPGASHGNVWQQVGAEWHVFAGRFDMYATITGRKTAILASSKLSSTPVALA